MMAIYRAVPVCHFPSPVHRMSDDQKRHLDGSVIESIHPPLPARDQMERVKGIEPSWPAWKAGALPLSYTRLIPAYQFILPFLAPY